MLPVIASWGTYGLDAEDLNQLECVSVYTLDSRPRHCPDCQSRIDNTGNDEGGDESAK